MGRDGLHVDKIVSADLLANVFLVDCRSFSSLNGLARERGIQLALNRYKKYWLDNLSCLPKLAVKFMQLTKFS